MAENVVHEAVQRALSESLARAKRQLDEVQSSLDEVRSVLSSGGAATPQKLVGLLPHFMQMQAASASLSATIESVLRFVGASSQWASIAAASVGGAAPAAPTVETPAPAEPAPPVETEVEPVVEEARAEAASVAEPAVEEAPAEPAPVEEAPPEVEEVPAPGVDIDSLPDDLKKLHKKAKRFAKVTVQELFMYKKGEVEKGRKKKDLYERFKEEIDKSKELYDKRFEKIADHNIDYLYDELVRVLAENDASKLGDYPYS